jgi:hypothetical protein
MESLNISRRHSASFRQLGTSVFGWVGVPNTSAIEYRASFISSQFVRHLLNNSITPRSFLVQCAVLTSLSVETADNYFHINRVQSKMRVLTTRLQVQLKQSPQDIAVGLKGTDFLGKTCNECFQSPRKGENVIQDLFGCCWCCGIVYPFP